MNKGYTAKNLLHRSRLGPGESGLVNRVTPVEAEWEHLSVEIRRFRNGERWSADTGDAEGVVALLGGG